MRDRFQWTEDEVEGEEDDQTNMDNTFRKFACGTKEFATKREDVEVRSPSLPISRCERLTFFKSYGP